jgi:hypothetical protein
MKRRAVQWPGASVGASGGVTGDGIGIIQRPERQRTERLTPQ